MYGDTATVTVVDGRGGDQGRDIVVVDEDARTWIYQLKYFPDGFAKNVKGRRPQIKRSFLRAMSHRPWAWILVVPCNRTDSERDFVDDLHTDHPLQVRDVWDRSRLDKYMSLQPGLHDYWQRDSLLEQARVYQQEQAILCDGDDLAHRVEALGKVVDSRDEDWTWDFQRTGDTNIQILRAQHPRAHERSPVNIELTLDADPDLKATMRRSLGYGLPEEISFPPAAVQRLDVRGPDWLTKSHEHVQAFFVPIPQKSPTATTMVDLRFVDDADRTRGSHEGVLLHRGSGSLGHSLKARFHSCVDLTFLLPHVDGEPYDVEIHVDIAHRSPTEVLGAIAVTRSVLAHEAFELRVGHEHVGIFGSEDPRLEDTTTLARLDELHMLAEDLDTVQRHCNTHFAIPPTLTARERIDLRVIRLLLDGHCVVHPTRNVRSARLLDDTDPTVRALLRGEGASFYSVGPYDIDVAGRVLAVGQVASYHPNIVLAPTPTPGQGDPTNGTDGPLVRLTTADGTGFHLFMPDRLTPGSPPSPTPLGMRIPGFQDSVAKPPPG